ncbi:MAG: MaoC domain protein dehydratase [Nocardioides sp.]|nr:MaoC domain protein dehydratase [Nocardioides sp.]
MTTTSADTAPWEWSLENLDDPAVFGPRDLVVDRALVRQHAYVHGTAEDLVCVSTGEVTPMVLASRLLRIYEERHQRHAEVGGLHLREALAFSSPLWLGEDVTIAGRFAGWYESRNGAGVVLDSEARGSDGRLIARARTTELLPEPPSEAPRRQPMPGLPRKVVPGPSSHGRAGAGLPPRHVTVGMTLPSLSRHLDQGQISLYSGSASFERNLHTDATEARERGYPRPIAQGMHLCGLVDEFCLRFFGTRWWSFGRFDVRFVAPTLADTTVEVGARVAGVRHDEGVRVVDLELWTRTPDAVVMVGVASAPF